MKKRSQAGQSLVEYAIGIGAVAAVCMVALGSLGFISWNILHSVEHAFNTTQTSHHAGRTIKSTATPWVLD